MDRRGAADLLQPAALPRAARRALRCALAVGSLLVAIDHGEAILAGELGASRLLRAGLTVLVPCDAV